MISIYYLILLIQISKASIPLHKLNGEWIVSGMYIEKGTLNTTQIENQQIKTHMTNNKLDITNESSKSKYYLYSINSTSFLFENNGTSHDSKYLEYPFIFTIQYHHNVYYSSFKARQHSWVDILITNNGTTITLMIYSPNYTTIILMNKKVIDVRSPLKKYYLFVLIFLYIIVFILPKYIIKFIQKLFSKSSKSNHSSNSLNNISNIVINSKKNN